ncbi:MAG: DUF2116 family Zn-ribbon domain-containing protein [Candidatus Helarchaeota archaeon]|nr:DUF2116 family Zn-ribbon domain-containing protein [Candidatus Helarchaeota archaeon]
MVQIQNKKKSEDSSTSKKQKWIKKWEPHKHCSVCGVAIGMDKEDFCSSKCSGEYQEWKLEQEKKNKRNSMMMMILMGVMVLVLFLATMLG